MGRTYTRVYVRRIIKYLVALGITVPLIFGIFQFLVARGDIEVTGHSGDMTCAGTIADPCYAYINFTMNKDYIYIYPNESWLFSTDEKIEKIEFQVRDLRFKTGWRTVDLSRKCSWLKPETECRYKYSYRFYKPKGLWQVRIVGYKKNPADTIKWSFGDIDPYWYGAWYYAELELERPYGFRGEKINITTETDYSNMTVEIYNPSNVLIYNQTWDVNESRLIPISQDADLGDYRIYGYVPSMGTERWFTVVNDTGFKTTSFPFNKTHKGTEYQIYGNKTLIAKRGDQQLSLHLPDLPSGVTVNAFNNSDIFVARFKSDPIDIDLSLIFIHDGAKLVINGTSNTEKNFSFKFYSPRQIKKYFDRLELQPEGAFGYVPDLLIFDWKDLLKAKEHLSYNHTTHTLTVFNVPETFRLDPIFGETGTGTNDWTVGFGDVYKFASNHTLTEAGTVTKISVYTKAWDKICRGIIYDSTSVTPVNLKVESANASTVLNSWTNFTVSVALDPAEYYIGIICWVNASTWKIRVKVGEELDQNADTPPTEDPWGTHDDRSYIISAFATYTTAPTDVFNYTKIDVYINDTENADEYIVNNTAFNITGVLNITGPKLNFTSNFTHWANYSAASPHENSTQILNCTANNTYWFFNVTFEGNITHNSSTNTRHAICWNETAAVVSTCTNYASTGQVDCKDNCENISSTVIKDLHIYSTGAGILNFTDITIQGDLYENYTHSCSVYWYGYRNITGG